MVTVIAEDKAATSNPFLSLLRFQAGINLSSVSDNKDLFDMKMLCCQGHRKILSYNNFKLAHIPFPLTVFQPQFT